MRLTQILLLIRAAAAVVPGAYCGTLKLPMGLGTNRARVVVEPNRHTLAMELHGPHLDMHCPSQEFSADGYSVKLERKGCVPHWASDHGVQIKSVTHDPRAMTIQMKLRKKFGFINYNKTLKLRRCLTAPKADHRA